MRQPGEPIFINRDFRVVDEAPDWIVVDKPPHLLVHPTAPNGPFTLWDGLRELLAFEIANGGQISIINRLDRETSGLVLIAKNPATAKLFGQAMQAGLVQKKYLALVVGHPTWEHEMIDAPLLRQGSVEPTAIYLKHKIHPLGAVAQTHFSVVRRFLLRTDACFHFYMRFHLLGGPTRSGCMPPLWDFRWSAIKSTALTKPVT
jgi:23S rRNA pseudouridine1911/1915/1917 synthase